MSAFLAPMFGAGYQAFNNQGSAVLSGGKLYTYQAGSTAPQATWTDSTQSVANANPVILNSAGRPANEIWLQGGSSYKFVLTDANGTQLGAWDNISGLNDANYQGFSEWIPFTTAPTYVSATTFTVSGNQVNTFQVGRRVQAFMLSKTLYGTINTVTYNSGAGTTSVVVSLDSGSYDSTLYAVSYGFMSAVNTSLPVASTSAVIPASLQGQTYTTASVSGTTGTYTMSLAPSFTLATNSRVFARMPETRTGAATLNVNGGGAVAIKQYNAAGNKIDPVLFINQPTDLVYDGTHWVLIDAFSTVAAFTSGTIDGVVIGGTSPSSGAFTSLSASGFTLNGTQTMTGAAINEAQSSAIASASTVDLGSAAGNYVHVTGTTAITAVTLAQGSSRTVVFDGVLTLTNGASLILPNGVNITTAAGDVATFRGEAAGVVRCVAYTSANGVFNTLQNRALTSGRVTYAGTAGLLQDSASFTWDGTTLVTPSHTTNTATTGSTNKGPLNYGTLSFSDTGIVQSAQTSVNSYFQNVIQNTSAGTAASAEFIAYNDQGTASTNYATVGINSSGYSGTGSINAPGYAYFLSASTDLVLGTIGANGIHFTTNSSATDALAISSAGAVSLPGGAANGVAYLNSSKVLTTGSALTFDGATLGVNSVSVGRGAGAVSTNTAVGANALAANTTGSSNSGFGVNALNSNQDGIQNSAFGYQALNANVSGYYNVGMGYRALFNSTGNSNVGIGAQALQANTTASNNTAVGYQTSYNNTTGDQNVAIGKWALLTNQTGASNVAVGARALEASTANYNTALGFAASFTNTTGTRNVSVGYLSLYTNSTGTSNTSVGASALVANTTGSNNTAVGDGALSSNTTALYNTAVGYQAAVSNTTGAGNTAVGRTTLNSNTTGSGNTAVGGFDGSVLPSMYYNSTGANNTAMGVGALSNNTTGNNSVAIGFQAAYAGAGAAVTAVGFQAGYANTDNSGGVFVGYQSGKLNSTGNGNTAVGTFSLTTNSTGAYNTAVGYQALNTNTASNNTAVGYEAGYTGTTASGNTFIGSQTGYGITTGTGNTFIGNNAFSASGYFVTTGSKNTILGSYSGNQGGLDIRTASNFIVLSDGDGNPRGFFDSNGVYRVGTPDAAGTSGVGVSINPTSSGVRAVSAASTGATETFSMYSTGASAYRFYVDWGGTIHATSIVITAISDQRLKENVRDIDTGLGAIMALKPRRFDWKEGKGQDKKNAAGFIAQEFETVFPECVSTSKAGEDGIEYKNINHETLIPTLVKAIQEQQAMIEQLTTRLAAAGI